MNMRHRLIGTFTGLVAAIQFAGLASGVLGPTAVPSPLLWLSVIGFAVGAIDFVTAR